MASKNNYQVSLTWPEQKYYKGDFKLQRRHTSVAYNKLEREGDPVRIDREKKIAIV